MAGGGDGDRGKHRGKGKRATATLVDGEGAKVGKVTLYQWRGKVTVAGRVKGLTPGFHGFHIHAVGKCEGPAFTTAGGHFKTDGQNHNAHAGDLPSLLVNADGTASAAFETDRFSIAAAARRRRQRGDRPRRPRQLREHPAALRHARPGDARHRRLRRPRVLRRDPLEEAGGAIVLVDALDDDRRAVGVLRCAAAGSPGRRASGTSRARARGPGTRRSPSSPPSRPRSPRAPCRGPGSGPRRARASRRSSRCSARSRR